MSEEGQKVNQLLTFKISMEKIVEALGYTFRTESYKKIDELMHKIYNLNFVTHFMDRHGNQTQVCNQRFISRYVKPAKLNKKAFYTVTLSFCIFQLNSQENIKYDPQILLSLLKNGKQCYWETGLPVIFFLCLFYYFNNPYMLDFKSFVKLEAFFPERKRDQNVFWAAVVFITTFLKLKIGTDKTIQVNQFPQENKNLYIDEINQIVSSLVNDKKHIFKVIKSSDPQTQA